MNIKSSPSFNHKIDVSPFKKKSLLWQRPEFLVFLVIVMYLLVGLLVVTQYSESVDEPDRITYANHSLKAYLGRKGDLTDEKGPFYGMLALLGAKGLERLFPGWTLIDGWHYMTFVSFIVGVYFFYRLCRRLVDPSPAFAATLLFSSQPLLWGHAYINPKDIPFMAFFLASVCLGLEMVDHLHAQLYASGDKQSLKSELSAFRYELAREWASASNRLRKLLESIGLLLAALGLSYWLVQALIARLVILVYSAPPGSRLGKYLRGTAENMDQIPVQAYISKAHTIYHRLALSGGIGLCVAGVLVALLIFISVRKRIVHVLLQRRVLIAGCFVGFCSDIRTLGPASALLVSVYFLNKSGRRAIPYLLEYLGVGMLSIYAFWPYLWTEPFNHFKSSLSEAADFPWNGRITFAGQVYTQGNQPASYLPVVFTVQFTETALVLILTGILLAGFYLVRRPNLRMDMLLLGAWFAAPLAAAILLHSTLYNNFRQFLFVVPPLFVFAVLTLQELWNRLKHRGILYVPLVMLILLPGLYWDWQLHPYQYLYYNSLVGGVAGASRKYDLDYWNSAYKEALDYVNRVAPNNASVVFWSNKKIAVPYGRPDLTLRLLTNSYDPGAQLNTLTNYAILTTQDNADQICFPASKEIYKVQRAGALLAVVKQIDKGDPVQCHE